MIRKWKGGGESWEGVRRERGGWTRIEGGEEEMERVEEVWEGVRRGKRRWR